MELWDIYDRNGIKTNKLKSDEEDILEGEYHLAIEAWIINSASQILIQKRADSCKVLPNIWGLTTGKLISGETSINGCIREVKEELGLKIMKEDITFIRRIFRTDLIWDLYLIKKDFLLEDLILQKSEVSKVKWVSIEKFTNMLEEGTLFKYPEIYEIIECVFTYLD